MFFPIQEVSIPNSEAALRFELSNQKDAPAPGFDILVCQKLIDSSHKSGLIRLSSFPHPSLDQRQDGEEQKDAGEVQQEDEAAARDRVQSCTCDFNP